MSKIKYLLICMVYDKQQSVSSNIKPIKILGTIIKKTWWCFIHFKKISLFQVFYLHLNRQLVWAENFTIDHIRVSYKIKYFFQTFRLSLSTFKFWHKVHFGLKEEKITFDRRSWLTSDLISVNSERLDNVFQQNKQPMEIFTF